MDKEKIIIVGAGLSTTSFLSSLSKMTERQLDITIVDAYEKMGKGAFCYNDSTLMNTPSEVLGICSQSSYDFINWYEREYLTSAPKFVSRFIFGKYISFVFNLSIDTLKKKGCDIRIKHGYMQGFGAKYVKVNDVRLYFNRLILARGAKYNNFDTLDIIEMISCQGREIYNIKGAGLTAVDATLELLRAQPNVKVNLYSRSGKLPQVKTNDLSPIKAKYFTESNFERSNTYTLRSMYRLARKEFARHNLIAKDIIFGNEIIEPQSEFEESVYKACKGDTFFNIILGMMLPLASMWKYLPKNELSLYHEKFHRYIHYIHGAMPLIRAIPLLDYINDGKVSVYKINEQDYITYDIDCSGHRKITNSSLYYSPETCRLEGFDNIYGIGMEIRYSNPFMNNIERIVEISEYLAGEIVEK
ncbi:FAD/NAD(P)-binding protein [Aliivibrio fischeri]|uniref:FAD/NAD(P)-binding protein n=1 Tax=Aliivibrio fischeri TaxID=668 RepID=UPI001F2B09AB|nr:FAD/NAD(P)-binding protein [Aliivibrio fischeri]MCE7578151.1 FAD/NAD(P)-binding protein [Aliivibrio fischeri]MCE7590538.1 FAD/NAD(P)-binding protein [Aliivibrio fischeri]